MGVGDGVGTSVVPAAGEGVSDRAGRVGVSSDAEIGAGLSVGDAVSSNVAPEAGVSVSTVVRASICFSAELVEPHALKIMTLRTASKSTPERLDRCDLADRFRAIDPLPAPADVRH